MFSIARLKTLPGFIALLIFACSANALLFGSHVAEETRTAMTVAGEAGHNHEHSSDDHGDGSSGTHCCDTHHSHDVTGSDPFELASWHLRPELAGTEPPSHLLEVFPERFIPPQHQA